MRTYPARPDLDGYTADEAWEAGYDAARTENEQPRVVDNELADQLEAGHRRSVGRYEACVCGFGWPCPNMVAAAKLRELEAEVDAMQKCEWPWVRRERYDVLRAAIREHRERAFAAETMSSDDVTLWAALGNDTEQPQGEQ